VSHAPDFPEHFRYALRVAGPLLAIGVNSPFLPQRAVNRIAADPPLVPMNVDPSGRFDDAFRHFEHKHGTFWRWIQPVFDGPTPAAANARIEFRALPAQPTIRDSIAFVAAFAGLMESLPRREHPVASLDWEVARENFYAAMRDGRDAVLRWITANGEDTDDAETALTELLEHASDGLAPPGLSASEADAFLNPLRARVENGVTPAEWKRREVRRRVDEGASIDAAVRGMQEAYVERQAEALVDGTFREWLNE